MLPAEKMVGSPCSHLPRQWNFLLCTGPSDKSIRLRPDRIKDALDGPADVHDESAKSNRGRNLMFELGLASRLRSKGLSVDLPVNPDIIARTEMAPIYIQCKRPFRQETIANNIHVAEKQLTRDLDQATNPQAEASSQYLYRGSSMLAASSCTRGARYHGGLGKEVQRLGETYREAWSAISNPRIIAILFHLITPAFVEDLALLTTAQQIVGLHLPGRSQADTALLRGGLIIHHASKIGQANRSSRASC